MTELLQLLSFQHDTLSSLKLLVSEEKLALTERDADKLLSLAKDKVDCLNNLKLNDEKLASHPEKALLNAEPELIVKVEEAKAILDECKAINSQNASLIELNIASLNRFSQALQMSRNASSLTYNDKGRTSTISSLGQNLKA
ncbi:flagella synthesis protein FlgN [Pseudomonadota bacterium]|uniref:flagella synthesis protein FlgN n=1 Tax=unclassified Shewanella TaxID=196818 RepID=UPI000C82CAAB|nr:MULTISPECIES: flagellar protein FlgN [unclassified Shewanella]MDO6618578.1 flagellar protein FlgN [Shewanella sp. 6_MG-2023]MDO6641786.1 flagellar protein FlgN [Shewanella sp. 5_MG-2023]MDO6678493.1 flagellar protein FlgN [Shewanella sp. 4_MG-2023]MDO6774765.1 flagellar protein FlgN [Shewanella sp. 3_MG-2023]PMG32052.1 flagellar biosynthesis protein FlgN [Shewanella sp. 10N.286.52.C2]